MKPLSKGDPCRVRLHTGEVVEAVYDEPIVTGDKKHFVKYKNDFLVAVKKTKRPGHCRFVGNPCDLVPLGVSA